MTITEILSIPYKRLLDLRSAREQALIKEKEDMERIKTEQNRAMARERILQR